MNVINVNLSEIRGGKENYRSKEAESDVSGLMASIRKTGLLNPITVRKRKGKGYDLVAGFRRYRACLKLKHTTIGVNVIESDSSDIIVNLVENLQRENSSSYEIGRGMYRSMKADSLTEGEIAVLLGMARPTVVMYLSLFKDTPVEFRDRVRTSTKGGAKHRTDGTVSNSAAIAIIQLKKKGTIDSKRAKELFVAASKDSSLTKSKIQTIATSSKSVAVMSKNTKVLHVNFKMTMTQYRKLEKMGGHPHNQIRDAVKKQLGVKLLN